MTPTDTTRRTDLILAAGTLALILLAAGVMAATGAHRSSSRGPGRATTTSSPGT
jgi:hypothetical protein